MKKTTFLALSCSFACSFLACASGDFVSPDPLEPAPITDAGRDAPRPTPTTNPDVVTPPTSPCAEDTVTIRNEAESLPYAACAELGNLVVTVMANETLTLPALKHVKTLEISETLNAKIELPQLTNVDQWLSLTNDRDITLSVPELVAIGGSIGVTEVGKELAFPKLKNVGGGLRVHSTKLVRLRADALEEIAGDVAFESSPALLEVSFNHLKTAQGFYSTENVSLQTIDLSALDHAKTIVLMQTGTAGSKTPRTLALPLLTQVDDAVLVVRTGYSAVLAPLLANVGDSFGFVENDRLSKLDARSLATIANALSVAQNPKLAELDLRGLTSVGTMATGKLPYVIMNNASLPVASATAPLEQIQPTPESITCGNKGGPSC